MIYFFLYSGMCSSKFESVAFCERRKEINNLWYQKVLKVQCVKMYTFYKLNIKLNILPTITLIKVYNRSKSILFFPTLSNRLNM